MMQTPLQHVVISIAKFLERLFEADLQARQRIAAVGLHVSSLLLVTLK